MDGRNVALFIYGGLASCIAEFVTFPIDTVKTRLQIQGQTIDAKHQQLKYKGMIDALVKISKEEGVRSLYSGIWPAVLRQATYGTIKYGSYYTMKSVAINYYGETVPLNIACGALAGAFSSAIANPTDVLKVRMQVAGAAGEQAGLIAAFKDIYVREGIPGLWRGVIPTAQRAIVLTAVQLPLYDFAKENLNKTLGDNVVNHVASSAIASFGASLSCNPIEVIRTRLMNQRKFKDIDVSSQKVYTGVMDCLLRTVRTEGFLALYKGFLPMWLRMGPWNVIFFISFEQFKKLY